MGVKQLVGKKPIAVGSKTLKTKPIKQLKPKTKVPRTRRLIDTEEEYVDVDDLRFHSTENKEKQNQKRTKEIVDVDDEIDEHVAPRPKISDKASARLKEQINKWVDCDDQIKTINARLKKIKDTKKQQEEIVIKMLERLEVENEKFDITGKNNTSRGRVYRHKSVTKEPLKESIIKSVLMETIRNEKQVNQLIKKIDDKRPMKERFYLKRTKGPGNIGD